MYDLDYEQLVKMFKMFAPDLSELAEETIKDWIDWAYPHVRKCRFGSLYYQALVYYAAHLASLNALISNGGSSGEGVVTGPIVSRREGDLSLTYGWYGSGGGSSSDLDKTIYGQMFNDLVGKVGGGDVMTRFTRMC